MAFPPFGYSEHVVVSFPLTFSQTQKGDALFHHIAYGYSCADWNGLCYHLRDVSMDNIFKLSASATASQ